MFTYGTLMKNQRNSFLMKKAKFLGDAVLENYCLYEIGTFPAAIPMNGFKVYGEVYEVSDEDKVLIDELEDEGFLYTYKLVNVLMNNELVEVGFYEFIDNKIDYPIRKPDGKWSSIRNDIDER